MSVIRTVVSTRSPAEPDRSPARASRVCKGGKSAGSPGMRSWKMRSGRGRLFRRCTPRSRRPNSSSRASWTIAAVDAESSACPPWPRCSREGTLDLHCGGHRLGGTEEHHEKRVALGIDFPALIDGEGGPQQGPVCIEHRRVLLPQVSRERGAVLDVSVEHREGATRQLRHRYAPLRPLHALAAYTPPFRHASPATSTTAAR